METYSVRFLLALVLAFSIPNLVTTPAYAAESYLDEEEGDEESEDSASDSDDDEDSDEAEDSDATTGGVESAISGITEQVSKSMPKDLASMFNGLGAVKK